MYMASEPMLCTRIVCSLSVFLQLNKFLTLRCVSYTRMTLHFFHNNERYQTNVGATIGCQQPIMGDLVRFKCV